MPTEYLLREDQIPRHWYNILADLDSPPTPVLHPQTRKPVGPQDLAPLFPMAIIDQDMSTRREVPIPDEVRAALALWRPSPLFRAERLERAVGTRSHIYYKYEGVSPSGSHKPNTAVAQAFYNAKEGVKRLATETGAGQWGSSLAFAGAPLRARGHGLHGAHQLRAEALSPLDDADLGCEGLRLPHGQDERGARHSREGPALQRVPRHRDFRSGRGRGDARRYEVLARFGAQSR